MVSRTNLTTKITVVNFFNTQIAKVVPELEHIFLSVNLVKMGDDQAMAISMEFLNTITLVGMPLHRLALKVGILVILLRNLNVALRLCNGTHLIIWRLTRRLIVVQIIGDAHVGNIVNIPRITTITNCSKWPFTLQRC